MLCSLSVCSRHMGSPRQWLPHQGDKETRHSLKTGRSFSNSLDKVITLCVVWSGICPHVRHMFACDIMGWKAEEIAARASRSLQGWTPCLLWRLKLWPVSASNWLVFTSHHYNTSLKEYKFIEMECRKFNKYVWKSNLLLLQTLCVSMFFNV